MQNPKDCTIFHQQVIKVSTSVQESNLVKGNQRYQPRRFQTVPLTPASINVLWEVVFTKETGIV